MELKIELAEDFTEVKDFWMKINICGVVTQSIIWLFFILSEIV